METRIERWIGETGKWVVAVKEEGQPELWAIFETKDEADRYERKVRG